MTDVATPIKAYEAMEDDRHLPRTLMGGTKAMRKAGTMYLPKHPKEKNESYKRRLSGSFLFNGFKLAIQGLRGRVFSKPVEVVEPPQWAEELIADVDLEGRDLTAFAFDVFTDGLADGIDFIYVDHPPMNQGATLEDERSMGARPYFVHVRAQQVIGWRFEGEGSQRMLTQLRVSERVTEPDGEFGEEEHRQIRVLEPGRWTVYREREDREGKTEWYVWDEGATSLSYIPIVPFYTGRTGEFEAEPPLIDLAYKNLEHWQSASDQRHILHVARVPVWFAKGFEDVSELVVGANSVIAAESTDATFESVDQDAAPIEQGAKDLETLKGEMEVMSFRPLVEKAGNVTATAKSIDSAQANTVLQAWAGNLQDALEVAFYYAGQYRGLDEAVSVDVNKDYGVSAQGAQELDSLLKARVAGEITRRTFLKEWKRRGALHDGVDVEEEIEETGEADFGGQ